MTDKETDLPTRSAIPIGMEEGTRADNRDISPVTHHPALPGFTGAIGPSIDPVPHLGTEEELVSAAQRGTPLALEHLLSRYRPAVYRTARRLSGSAEDAEDLVQETMFRAYKSFGSIRGEAHFSSWLVAIAVYRFLSKTWRESRFRWIYLSEHNAENRHRVWDLFDKRRNPEQEYQRRELHRLVRREVFMVHPKFRTILQLCVLEELSIEDIAQTLGITRAAAKSRLHRARKPLSGAFRRHVRMHHR